MQGSGSMRGWTAAIGSAVVLAGLVVVGIPQQAPAPPGDLNGVAAGRPDLPPQQAGQLADRGARIDALLARRAEAIRARDETAFLATLDPQASPAFLREQRELFKNLADVPLTHWSYEVDPFDTARLTPGSGDAGALWAPKVVLRYAVAQADVVPTTRPMGYLFTRRGESWYLTDDDDPHDSGRRTWRGPWDFGPVESVPTRSGIVMAHPGTRELADRAAEELDDAVAVVTEVWGEDWPRQVGVLVPDSRAELQSLVGPQFAVDGIAAVAVADRVDPSRGVVQGPRVVLNPSTAGSLSQTALRVVLQHEITHVAARGETVDGSPMWLLEGFADYVGYRDSGLLPREIAPDLARQVHHQGPPGQFPSDRDFHLAGHRLDLAYQQAWSLVAFLVDEVGEQRVVELYHRIAGSGSHAAVGTALADLTGMDSRELVVRWAASLPRTFR
nr:basic secretory family protein [Allosaccharopolyspora coralli]